ncbi:MAG: RNHCP domain-containing protein [Chloroflexota bacterium]|nr:RNHCP domain-containing protein [Chloroflexota bacterium]
MPPLRRDEVADDFNLAYECDLNPIRRARPGHRAKSGHFVEEGNAPRAPRPGRPPDGSASFKCRHCRVFVGPTLWGGRHRNHCPLCLHSRHVDLRRPGDRASLCRSLMAPVGIFCRPKGEQVVVHRCLGCGLERYNRIAADDHPLILLRLPPVPPRYRGAVVVDDETERGQERTA